EDIGIQGAAARESAPRRPARPKVRPRAERPTVCLKAIAKSISLKQRRDRLLTQGARRGTRGSQSRRKTLRIGGRIGLQQGTYADLSGTIIIVQLVVSYA